MQSNSEYTKYCFHFLLTCDILSYSQKNIPEDVVKEGEEIDSEKIAQWKDVQKILSNKIKR